jgi:hypothetical protein
VRSQQRDSIGNRTQAASTYFHAFKSKPRVSLRDPILSHSHPDAEQLLGFMSITCGRGWVLLAECRLGGRGVQIVPVVIGIKYSREVQSGESMSLRFDTQVSEEVLHEGVSYKRVTKGLALCL